MPTTAASRKVARALLGVEFVPGDRVKAVRLPGGGNDYDKVWIVLKMLTGTSFDNVRPVRVRDEASSEERTFWADGLKLIE